MCIFSAAEREPAGRSRVLHKHGFTFRFRLTPYQSDTESYVDGHVVVVVSV